MIFNKVNNHLCGKYFSVSLRGFRVWGSTTKFRIFRFCTFLYLYIKVIDIKITLDRSFRSSSISNVTNVSGTVHFDGWQFFLFRSRVVYMPIINVHSIKALSEFRPKIFANFFTMKGPNFESLIQIRVLQGVKTTF